MSAASPHIYPWEVFDLLDEHAARISLAVQPMPAEFEHVNLTYLQELYPYKPQAILDLVMHQPLDTPEARDTVAQLFESASSAVPIIQSMSGVGVIGAYELTSESWTTVYLEHIRQYPLADDLLNYRFVIGRELALYVHALDPQQRQWQREAHALSMGRSVFMDPREQIWLGRLHLEQAVEACLTLLNLSHEN